MTLTARLATLLSLGLAACSGGHGGGSPFLLLETDPVQGASVFLNQSISFRFTSPVDLETADFNTVSFQLLGGSGKGPVSGSFSHGRTESGERVPTVLEFHPRLPCRDRFQDGGFEPDTEYRVLFPGGRGGTGLRDERGKPLSPDSPIQQLRFRTVAGTHPGELFRDTKPGGPTVVSIEIGPRDEASGAISLNRLGDLPVEILLRFDQPLDPSAGNLPCREPEQDGRGRVHLEYDDPELGIGRWIPARVELLENAIRGATVSLGPIGVLPNAARVRVVVEAELEDLSGENNSRKSGYQRVVGSFETEPAFEPQFDAVLLDFEEGSLDEAAAFRDPSAELADGVLRAAFDFEGIETPYDWKPGSGNVILRTDLGQVQVSQGPVLTVAGGVYSFHDIEIDRGGRVQGVGPNPLVLLATGTVRIAGHLSVDGGDGASVHSIMSPQAPTAGGQGGCGGGNGGVGSPDGRVTSLRGATGFGPGNRSRTGGQGGEVACGAARFGPGRGGGGGGGSFATPGDPDFYGHTNDIVRGKGGRGGGPGISRAAGGRPGPRAFQDRDPENDFWGRQIDGAGRLVTGELTGPLGGSGGGGGGDQTIGTEPSCIAPSFVLDRKGGGGGGGGGVLIIKALGPILVTETGLVSANGGSGGGGETAGSSVFGGGGGGGSGGMVVLMSSTRIELETHGNVWSAAGKWDADFSVSADGSFGLTSLLRDRKYLGEQSWNAGAPNRGGFGGMGLVQLMAPPGDDRLDGTGSVQDDNIVIVAAGTGKRLAGKTKLAYLLGGDLRPVPRILPVPFGRYSQARTPWISTGATVRREVARLDGARSLDRELGRSGPDYFFAGLQTEGGARGYLRTDPKRGRLEDPIEVEAAVAGLVPQGGMLRGRRIHVVRLEGSPLPSPKEKGGFSFVNHRARLLEARNVRAEFRVAGHGRSELYLDAEEGPLPASVDRVQIIARFLDVRARVDGRLESGLGPVHTIRRGNVEERHPVANVRIGFAFHKGPLHPRMQAGLDLDRIPKEPGAYLYGLDLGEVALRDEIRSLHAPWVQVQIRFNLDYDPDLPDVQPGRNPVGPRSPRPELRSLRLPYRF